jgi:ribose transport system ATP-binding protein
VLLVSHDLDEVLEVTDAVTVLRDGMVAGSGATASLDRDALIQLIVGRAVDLVTRPKHPTTSTVPPTIALTVDDLASPLVDHIDFTVNRGEILGLTGLAGSGYDQVPYLVYGAKPATSGTAFIQSSIGSSQAFSLEGLFPRAARKLGIGLLPSDRRNTAGVGTLDLIDNVTMLRLDKLRGWIGISRTKMRDDTANLLEDFDVRPRDPSHVFGTLSGGNQQKALLAKWLSSQPQILLIDEPTQGVDIGARSQIFDVLRDAAARGTSVICSSTDHEQLAVLTDRTLIFDKGRIIAELRGDQLTKNSISEACMAGSPSTTAPHPTNGNTTTVQELRP